MTIIKLNHRYPHCPINCTSVLLLVLPLANLAPAQAQQLHSRTAASAITKLERYFIKNGWMPKEA